MSGLYNMIMSVNRATPYLMMSVGIDEAKFVKLGRFRDCWITPDASSVKILHRNYVANGNQNVLDEVASWPNFVSNTPVSDETYAIFEFKVPAEMSDLAKKLVDVTDTADRWETFTRVIKDLGEGKKTEHTEKAMEAGKKIMDQLMSGKSGTVTAEDGSVDVATSGPLLPE